MHQRDRKLLLMQGFAPAAIEQQPEVLRLARWTPLSCATFGSAGIAAGVLPFGLAVCPCAIAGFAGLWTGSGWFFIALGLLTLSGGMSARSIYDRLYNATLRHLLHTSPIPPHGPARQFGCAFGGVMYIVSGGGFLFGHTWIAFFPAAFMVVFATIAGLTHWCFASALYHALFVRAARPPLR